MSDGRLAEIPDSVIDARDERVAKKIRAELERCREEASRLREEERQLNIRIRMIEGAVAKEEWWRLGSILNDAEIESLCEISPTRLLDDD